MNKKLEWTANVLTDHIMQGAETVTYNKEEMTGYNYINNHGD